MSDFLRKDFTEDFASAGAAHKIKEFAWILYQKLYESEKRTRSAEKALLKIDAIFNDDHDACKIVDEHFDFIDAPGNAQQQDQASEPSEYPNGYGSYRDMGD